MKSCKVLPNAEDVERRKKEFERLHPAKPAAAGGSATATAGGTSSGNNGGGHGGDGSGGRSPRLSTGGIVINFNAPNTNSTNSSNGPKRSDSMVDDEDVNPAMLAKLRDLLNASASAGYSDQAVTPRRR